MIDIKALKEAELKRANTEQSTASDPSHSAWVEASAGTGKTKVLSDRVLRLLLDEVTPSKILCLTFTKAAAVEMNARIYGKLSKWAVMSDKDLFEELQSLYNNPHVLEQKPELEERARKLFAVVLDAPQPLKIETIHGFCEEILKRFPLEADVSPYFEVMDDRTSNEILDYLSKDIIKEGDQTEDINMKNAISFLTQNIKEKQWSDFLKEIIENRHAFIKTFSNFKNIEEFQKSLLSKFNLKENTTKEDLIKDFKENLPRLIIKECAEALSQSSKVDKEHAAYLFQALEHFDYDIYKKAFLTKEGDGLANLAHKDAIKIRDSILADMGFELARVLDLEEKLKSIKVYEVTLAVATIALKLTQSYEKYKSRQSQLDYDDLIILTCRLLQKENVCSWVLYKLDNGIDHILIDEAQDTSPSQWQIVEALTNEFFSGLGKSQSKRTVFAVGDRKQSIFRFQGAEPERFDEMRHKYKNLISKSDFKEVDLAVSFRSAKAVLEMVNKLFSLEDAKKGVADNGSEVKHLPFRLGEGGLVELWPLVDLEEKEVDVWEEPVVLKNEQSAITKLALKIAQKIKDMVSSGDILESKARPVRYQDFMVLVKKRKPFMEEFVKACKKTGVAITGIDRLNLLEEIAVEDLISLANFLLLPEDDLSLAEVLKSPLYGLNDDDLFGLCFQRGERSLWQKLCANTRYTSVKDELSELLSASDYMRPFELFDMVLNTFEGRKRFYKRLGLQAKDGLDEFMNLALSFEQKHVPNLQNFIAWLTSNDIEIKRELEQPTTDAVRLMTVHTSKGLQAPIVILPDTVRPSQNRKEGGLIFDNDLFYYPLQSKDYNTPCTSAHKELAQKEADEYRRLLYVALTRAEDRLYIAGFGKPSKQEKSWYELCQETLEQMPVQKQKDGIVLSCPQEIEVEEKQKFKKRTPILKDESFAYKKAEQEKPTLKPYSPSHMEDTDDTPASSPLEDNGFCYKRGTIIHKLLQMLPSQSSIEMQEKLIKNYLKKQNDLSEKYKQDIEKEVLNVLQDKSFSFIFSENSRPEVPIMGEVDGKIISGQIDRLVIEKDKVVVVDFKTNRPAASKREDVLSAYVTQLHIYQKLLSRIYPNKEIETYILWTNTLKLMKI